MADKRLVAYVEPWSVRPGEALDLKVSYPDPGAVSVEVVRLICAERSRQGPGAREEPVVGLEAVVARPQALRPGSSVVVDLGPDGPHGEAPTPGFSVRATVWPTLPGDGRPQALVGTWAGGDDGFLLALDAHGAPLARLGPLVVSTGVPLPARRWATVAATFDPASGRLAVASRSAERRFDPAPTAQASATLAGHRSEGLDGSVGPVAPSVGPVALPAGRPLRMAARSADPAAGRAPEPPGSGGADSAGPPTTDHFDGKLEDVRLALRPLTPVELWDPAGDAFELAWDFAPDIDGDAVREVGTAGLGRHGRTLQCPARAVTGSAWTGATHDWRQAPAEYAAIHFHHDDLVDAGWATDRTVVVPADLPSGIYALRLRHAATGEEDRVPFFVRPAAGREGEAPVCFLVASASYLAYANHRQAIDGTPWFPPRTRLRPEQRYLAEHPEVGRSTYEHHPDGSGVMYSSRRRPTLNIRPGAEGWTLTSATLTSAFLERIGQAYEVLTDEDLHREGAAALAPYRVVITGPHPEYWSTPMHDALGAHLEAGGRLMYLGGNGFYWRVAFSERFPGVMEVRRAEDGTRGWASEPGESHHSFSGEYGGLWRRLGRPPNRSVGVGFVAAGFDRATSYRLTEAIRDPRLAFAVDGLRGRPGDRLGDHGIGGGAAGQEIDRYDPDLGSPAHALVLASSEDHAGTGILRTKEEFLATEPPVADGADPKVRADVTFFETPAGGAVFATGSISWAGALATDDYDNDVARLTENVVRRFVDPAPFAHPGGGEAASGVPGPARPGQRDGG